MKPSLYAVAMTLPEAWEWSLIKLRDLGAAYPGRYWQPGMPPGRQAQMTIRIERWCEEPRIHRGFPCSLDALFEYRAEILHGSERPWEYTYYDRMRHWGGGAVHVDQYRYALDCLTRKASSHKACISLAHPGADCVRGGDGTHIPCLRHIGWEISNAGELNTYLHWRARDGLNAAFLNLFGLSFLAEQMAADLSSAMMRPITVGGCIDVSDDYHING